MTTTTETTVVALDEVLSAASQAARPWARTPRGIRAEALDAIAAALTSHGDHLVDLAHEETNLPHERLRGELARTTFQLTLFAHELRGGAYLDVRIDHPDPEWPTGPRPDLRRILRPVGPVLVFAASNFPFAFSVAGGDTTSALAAGCPVVLKAHPGHPRLSQHTGEIVTQVLERFGPAGTFSLITGVEAGRAAITDENIAAASFTGSLQAGRALFDLASRRKTPIPFFGELGSLNPTVVTPAASRRRPEEIANGFVASFTLGVGQFCTKPGLLLVPDGSTILAVVRATGLPDPAHMLNDRISSGFTAAVESLQLHPAVTSLTDPAASDEQVAGACLFQTTVPDLLDDFDNLTQERFGPAALVVSYQSPEELLAVAERLCGQLTATVYGEHEHDSAALLQSLLEVLSERAGRVLWNQWPTGVSVSHAQQHGGPYPATTAPASTSVGTAAIHRFLRPVVYQGLPADLLPGELRDDARTQQLVDGVRRTG